MSNSTERFMVFGRLTRKKAIEPETPIVRDPIEARAGTRSRVNLVILVVSTLAAAAALLVILAPYLSANA
jgi:hypothetical protein